MPACPLTGPFGGRRSAASGWERDPFIKPRAPGWLLSLALGGGGVSCGWSGPRGPGEWEDPRLGAARGRFFPFPAGLYPSLWSFSLPRGGDGTSHPPRIPAPPPLLPSGAVAPPPSWHVRLRKEPNAEFWGPEQGDPPAVDSETYPALLPSPLGRGALRRAEAGSVPVRPGKEERAWRPLPPQNGRYHPAGEERAW